VDTLYNVSLLVPHYSRDKPVRSVCNNATDDDDGYNECCATVSDMSHRCNRHGDGVPVTTYEIQEPAIYRSQLRLWTWQVP